MPRKAKKPQRLSISAQIAEVLRSSSDLGTRLTRILELAVTLLKGDGGKIYLVDPRSNRLVLKAIIGQHPGLPAVGTTLRLDEGMAGKVLSTQRPLLVEDYSTYSNRVRIWEDVFKSVIEVPLLFDNAALGVFSVFTEGATPPLSTRAWRSSSSSRSKPCSLSRRCWRSKRRDSPAPARCSSK